MPVRPELLDQFRAHRAKLSPLSNLYPYAMGRIEEILTSPGKPSVKVAQCIETIAALDAVEGEPR